MAPISRRVFLASCAAVVVAAACSDDSSSSPGSSSATTSTDGSTDATTDATTATTAAPSTTDATPTTRPAPELASDPFTLGVASGDPDTSSVVLWTRLAPDPLHGGGMPDQDVDVVWEMSTDPEFTTMVTSGMATATTSHAHTVHVIAEPPEPTMGPFFYRFRVGEFTSPTGRTLIAPDGAVPSATFVSASCQNYEAGFYAAHADIASKLPDFVMWLGDYIYESAGAPTVAAGAARTHGTPEPTDLAAYRDRYALYKLDPNLQAAHATCPWFIIWDDHEVENNYAGLVPQDPADAPTFEARRRDAYVAWWEHQPVRLDPPSETAEYRIYRGAQWGDLLGITLLDTRQYRSDQACGDITLSLEPPCPETFDETRTLTGGDQEQWLFANVGTQDTTWNVIAQQVVMTDITFNGAVLNFDQWDGYPAARQRVLQHLADGAVPNAIVLSGDIHLAGVGVLHNGDRATGTPVAVEFVDTSISSSGLVSADVTDLVKTFPGVVDVELAHRGYTLHTVTPENWVADYRIVEDALVETSAVSTYRTFAVDAGTVAVRMEA